MSNYQGVMIFAEQENGKIHPVSYELLGKGKEIANRLGVRLSCVLLGSQIRKEEINELIYCGADEIFLYDHLSLKEFDPIRYKQNIVNLVEEEKPGVFLLGATHLGRSLGPRIAVALGTGLTADCIGLEIDERGDLIQIRPAFTGNILAHIRTKTKPQMSTVRYKVMEKGKRDSSKRGKIIRKNVVTVDNGLEIIKKEKDSGVNISEAKVIISGGMGLKKPSDFDLLNELADLCGGVVGSSRPLVDKEWIGKEHQVGFSGNTVKPKLYVACGISGAPQHLAGMRDSDIIVAINTDPSAPIFKVADYGIVGDLYEVVPKLINEITKRHPTPKKALMLTQK